MKMNAQNNSIFGFSVLILALILGVFIWGGIYRSGTKNENKEKLLMLADYSLVIEPESLNSKEKINLDSLVKIVNDNQEWIIRRQETLVNDIRQETNNTIDKLTLWAGIGIGLVGLLGCLIPMWQTKISRDELERALRRDFDSLMQKVKRQNTVHQLQSTAQCLTLGLMSSQVDDNMHLRLMNGNLWQSLCKNFSLLVSIITLDIESPDNRDESLNEDRIALLHALVQIDDVLRRVATRNADLNVGQRAVLMRDTLRKMINRLCASSFSFDDNFLSSLTTLVRELELFKLRF